ncbi:probable CoA ligase CCL8 isoform X2 [Ziziphus jujuba]|nr:probable CoA ligase CCL8 isoform X2 [Ziziphus jujuba var. spinosa]XP_060676387.1 probable CoA ligase CCL8 isoform X2 [Ziziphus jujuba]
MEVVKEVAKQGSEARDGVAIRADQKSYSYLELVSSAWRISRLLCGANLDVASEAGKNGSVLTNGVRKHGHLGGARIGIVAKPSAEFVASILGTWLSGGVAVPLALSYPEAELLHVMNDSEISLILSTEDHQELMKTVAAKTAAQFSLIPSVPSFYSEESAVDHLQDGEIDVERILQWNAEHSSEDPALIIYTSGTTGKPKGVVHTHKSIVAQVQTLTKAWEYTPADRFLHCLPLHHVHGFFNGLLAPLYAGATVEFLPKFSVRGIWQRWRESYPINGNKTGGGITLFTGVPTMYTRLVQGYEAMDPELKAASAFAAKQLRLMMCGSSALPLPTMQRWEAITGHRLLERYGMTEFVMAISNPLRGERKAGTVGKPFPGVEVKIIADGESGSDSEEVGELCVKSPSLFKEYWKRPEATKESFTDDGFFKTGDAGTVDEDGYYIILGRTSADIMKVGGYKLSALEIESILLEHPHVQECCVLGVEDKDYGEIVCAIIVLDVEAKKKAEKESRPALTLEQLCSWAGSKLAPYKLPTRLLLWDKLPRNAMGKVNKKDLKKKLSSV